MVSIRSPSVMYVNLFLPTVGGQHLYIIELRNGQGQPRKKIDIQTGD